MTKEKKEEPSSTQQQEKNHVAPHEQPTVIRETKDSFGLELTMLSQNVRTKEPSEE